MDTSFVGTAPRPDVAARLASYLPELTRPPGEARGLPGWVYTDPEVFALERERIFAPAWIGIAYESDVPRPGDVMAATYAGWRFILARGEDGVLRCFHNVCAHRGMQVLDGRRSQCRTLSCPWHMWTYDLTGRLIGTPNLGGIGTQDCDGFDKAGIGLAPVRCGAWLGVVFVNVDGQAPPLRDYLRPTIERLAAFDLSLTRESDEEVATQFNGNWKLAVEGGVEDYHIPWVHRELGPSGGFRGEGSGESWVGVTCRRTMEIARQRFAKDGRAGDEPLPPFPHFPETGEAEASVIISTLPATLVAAVLDHVTVSLFIPETPTHTRVRRRFRFLGDAADDTVHAARRRKTRDAWALITDQDGPLIETVHALSATRDAIGLRPRFSPYWEPAVHHFQKIVAGKLTGTTLV